jgi:hypothetical protein
MLNLTRRNALTAAVAGAAFGLPKPVSLAASTAENFSQARCGCLDLSNATADLACRSGASIARTRPSAPQKSQLL